MAREAELPTALAGLATAGVAGAEEGAREEPRLATLVRAAETAAATSWAALVSVLGAMQLAGGTGHRLGRATPVSLVGAGGQQGPVEGPTGSLSALPKGEQLAHKLGCPPGLVRVLQSLEYLEEQARSGSARSRAGEAQPLVRSAAPGRRAAACGNGQPPVPLLGPEGCDERGVRKGSGSADAWPGLMAAALAASAP